MRNRPENQIEIRLTLIRHGATLSNKEGRYLGKTDEALSPEGIGMLKKAATGGNYPTADPVSYTHLTLPTTPYV